MDYQELLDKATNDYLLLADVIFSLRAISSRKRDHEPDIVDGIEIAARLQESLREIYYQYVGSVFVTKE